MSASRRVDKRHAVLTHKERSSRGLQKEGSSITRCLDRPRGPHASEASPPCASVRFHVREDPRAVKLVKTASVGVPGAGGGDWLFMGHRVSVCGDGESGHTAV